MPTSTTNFSFNKPLVNDPVDEDLWGGQLNTNWDSIDTILDALTPIGSRMGYTGTAAPSSRWLLAVGQAVSRTTYAAYFALVSTSYGVGDGSTTFNMPDYRGRSAVGLDNMGGSSANRITDANADSLNNTGVGSETDAGSITINSVSLSASNIPTITGTLDSSLGTSSTCVGTPGTGASLNGGQLNSAGTGTNKQIKFTSTNTSGSSFTPTGSYTGTTGSNVQPSIAEGAIIRVL